MLDVSLLLEYGWVLAVLVVLEGLLAADNALVLQSWLNTCLKISAKKRCSMV